MPVRYVYYETVIERLDQVHLYPASQAGTLPKESHLDSLYAAYSELLHSSPSACVTNERFRIIASKLKAYDFYPNSTNGHAHHVGVTTIERLDQVI